MKRITDTDVTYEDIADKVVAQLKSYNSATYTRLATRVEKLTQLEAEIKAIKSEVKTLVKENIADLFAADDAVKTRVVDTVSFIMTLSKDPKPTESYQYAKIVEALSEHLTPELIVLLNDIKSKFKTVTQKEPSLKIQKKQDLTEALLNKMKQYFRKFRNFIDNWAAKYDKKLLDLKIMAQSV
jgi:hypothetical protein